MSSSVDPTKSQFSNNGDTINPMTITLHLDTVTSDLLLAEATTLHTSPEEIGQRLLAELLQNRQEQRTWKERNQLRHALIRKSRTSSLSQQEEAELQKLQDEMDKRLEPVGDSLLNQLSQLEHAVASLPSAE